MRKFIGGGRIDVNLYNMENTHEIFWSHVPGPNVEVNSYVTVDLAGVPAVTRNRKFIDRASGQEFMIASVNGIGEIRWWVEQTQYTQGSDLQAILYFTTHRVPNYTPYKDVTL